MQLQNPGNSSAASFQSDEVALNWDMLLSDGVRCLSLGSQCPTQLCLRFSKQFSTMFSAKRLIIEEKQIWILISAEPQVQFLKLEKLLCTVSPSNRIQSDKF